MSGDTLHSAADDGFGLTEALVAILLFGLIAIAAVPALIIGIKVSTESTSRATAATVAATQIELAREQTTNCDDFAAFLNDTIGVYEDSRGAAFTVSQTEVSDITCDDADPAVDVVTFTVNVSNSSLENPDAASVTTRIAIPSVSR